MAETIYVNTFYELNHGSSDYRGKPLDPRLLDSDRNYVWFLIDKEVPEPLVGQRVLFEKDFDPRLARAGAKHLAEWSFLLMELEHGFAEYPFFLVSSRFYEKNFKLGGDLNTEWDRLFGYLRRYRWGYLPSYNRRLRWLNYEHEKQAALGAKEEFSPFNRRSFTIVDDLFGVKIPAEYGAWTDFQCNYIGFASREDLVEYVEFYRPFFDHFFDADWELRRDPAPYVQNTLLHFRNEKPLTYLLEFISHLFFYAHGLKFFGLHYTGYYEIDERRGRLQRLEHPEWATPSWIASWVFHTRVVQEVWPSLTPAWRSRLIRGKARLLGKLKRRAERTPMA